MTRSRLGSDQSWPGHETIPKTSEGPFPRINIVPYLYPLNARTWNRSREDLPIWVLYIDGATQ